MTSLWESVKKGLQEGVGAVRRGATVAREVTGEAIKISKLRYSIYGLRSEIQDMFAEMGGLIFDGLARENGDILNDPNVLQLIEEVKEYKRRIDEIEAEIEQIHKDTKNREKGASKTKAEEAPPPPETSETQDSE